MTIIDIIREHVESYEPCNEHGRKAIVLCAADADALRESDFYQRTARYLRGIQQPAGCRYICTLQFGWPVDVFESCRRWHAMAAPADPEQSSDQTPPG